MSLLLFEGFDFLTNAALASKSVYIETYVHHSTTRYSYGSSITNSSSQQGAQIKLALPDTGSNYLIFGVACKWNQSNLSYNWGLGFFRGTGGQCAVTPNDNGVIHLRRGATDGTVLDTSDLGVWTPGTWHYLEGKLSCTNSSDYEIRLDGEIILSGSGVDLQAQASPGANVVQLTGGYGTSYSCYYDDLYICDDQGSKNNDFLGEVVVRTLLPTGAGTYTQWTPSAGSNYENVDDTTPDNDTTYNATGVLDNQDSFAMGNLPDSLVAIHGVKTRAIARKEGAGFRALKNFVVVSSSKYDEVKDTLSADYAVKDGSILEENPDDSQDWEVADIDAIEVGVQLAAVQSTTTTTV